MKKSIVLIVILFIVSASNSYSQSIEGKVVDNNGKPLQFVNIVLLSRIDSTYIAGTTSDKDGKFCLQTDSTGIIKASCIGYEDAFVERISGTPFVITLAPNTVMLNEVTVTSALPTTRLEDNGLVTNIKGTVLEKIGTARDVLGRLPGIIADNEGVSVFGKGSPNIYVNGQLVRNSNMLDQLSSTKIKKVELITEPGSRYDATVKSVIRITTERDLGEGWGVDNKAVVGYRDNFSLSEQVDLNYRNKGLDVFGMMQFDHSKTEGTSTNIQNTWGTQHYMQDVNILSHSKQQLYEGKIGFNYSLASNQAFGAYYEVTHKPLKTNSELGTKSWINELLEETSAVEKNVDTKETTHLVDGYYNGNFGKWSVDATFDFLWKKNNVDNVSDESPAFSQHRTVTVADNADAHLYAGELHLSHPVWKGSINFGTSYSFSQRCENSVNIESVIANSDDKVCESNAAAYVEMAQRFGKVNLRAGLRYEHIDSRYYNKGEKVNDQSHTYDNLFPSVSAMFPIKKSFMQLSYTRKYDRPLYQQLSGTIDYVNRYLYQSGNPLLKSQYTDDFSLTFKHNWLIIMATYTRTDGKIMDECLPYEDDATITLLRKGNSSTAVNTYQLLAVLSPHFGIWYPNLMMGVVAQDYKATYCGTDKTFNKPMFIVRYNNLFRLKHGYLVNADLNWRSSANSDNVRVGQVWSINAGVSKQFGKHWNVKLALNDIFNTSKDKDFIIYSGISDLTTTKRMTSRNIECTIRYNFNVTKSKYSGKGAAETERKRFGE